MNRILTLLAACIISVSAYTQGKYEIRAAWLTTVFGLDWPEQDGYSYKTAERQKAELTDMLDQLYELNFNTVLLQVRLRSDVAYDSEYEPYSYVFTGKTGKSPSYDPLAFAIEECHKRGMECHAWLVCIPAGDDAMVRKAGWRSPVKKNPSLFKRFKGQWYLNPGNPKTKTYLAKMAGEITEHYDIDGIHLDYIRYPESGENFPDYNEFRKYNRAGKTRAEWRRDNITAIVESIYKEVKSKKRWVKVTCATIGKYKDTRDYSSKGWNSFHVVKQDPVAWLERGIVDMIYPMTYFRDDHFFPFVADWQDNRHGRYVIPGLGIYFLDPKERNWDVGVIEEQINYCRLIGTAGVALYRTKFLTDNTKNLKYKLRYPLFRFKAMQPPMTWEDNMAPSRPRNAFQVWDGNTVQLSWDKSKDNSGGKLTYNIYVSDEFPVNTADPANILLAGVENTATDIVPVYTYDRVCYYAVTSTDMFGNESEAAQFHMEMPRTTALAQTWNEKNPIQIMLTDLTGKSASVIDYSLEPDFSGLKKGFYRLWCIYESGETKEAGYVCL